MQKFDSRIVCFLALVFLVSLSQISPVYAQTKAPGGDSPANTESQTLVSGLITGNAPKVAEKIRAELAKKLDSKSEFFANEHGILTVHKDLSRGKLRSLATWFSEQPGIRLALHDTPRRMILAIFSKTPDSMGPDAIAGPLEKVRKKFQQSLKRKLSQPELGSDPVDGPKIEPLAGTDTTDLTGQKPKQPEVKEPSTNEPKEPKKPEPEETAVSEPIVEVEPVVEVDPIEPEEPNEPQVQVKPKKPVAKTPEPLFDDKPYSYCNPEISEVDVKKVTIFGEITGRAALKLWFKGKERAKAVAVARKALKRNPRDTDAGVVAALFHLHTGNKLTAYRNLRTVLHYRPDVGLFHDIYGEVLEAMEMTDKAKDARAQAKDLGAKKYLEKLLK